MPPARKHPVKAETAAEDMDSSKPDDKEKSKSRKRERKSKDKEQPDSTMQSMIAQPRSAFMTIMFMIRPQRSDIGFTPDLRMLDKMTNALWSRIKGARASGVIVKNFAEMELRFFIVRLAMTVLYHKASVDNRLPEWWDQPFMRSAADKLINVIVPSFFYDWCLCQGSFDSANGANMRLDLPGTMPGPNPMGLFEGFVRTGWPAPAMYLKVIHNQIQGYPFNVLRPNANAAAAAANPNWIAPGDIPAYALFQSPPDGMTPYVRGQLVNLHAGGFILNGTTNPGAAPAEIALREAMGMPQNDAFWNQRFSNLMARLAEEGVAMKPLDSVALDKFAKNRAATYAMTDAAVAPAVMFDEVMLRTKNKTPELSDAEMAFFHAPTFVVDAAKALDPLEAAANRYDDEIITADNTYDTNTKKISDYAPAEAELCVPIRMFK